MIIPRFVDQDITEKRVFLRADLNVPLLDGVIQGDFRLKALQPTLDLLIVKKTRIILATHLGRPKKYTRKLSTLLLKNWFEDRGYKTVFAPDIPTARHLSTRIDPGTIVLLENMRFFDGEQREDQQFAQDLKLLADYYINDAFALLHRTDTSITLLPALFNKHDKSIGLLIARELDALTPVKLSAKHPVLYLLCGGKVKDKLPYIAQLLDKAQLFLVGPALSFTFLKAENKPVGKSLIDQAFIEKAKLLVDKAKKTGVSFVLPTDYQVALDTLQGPLISCGQTDFPDNGIGVSIGEQTLALFTQKIMQANTIIVNGAMGLLERPETGKKFNTLLQSIAQSSAYTVIGGGSRLQQCIKMALNQP